MKHTRPSSQAAASVRPSGWRAKAATANGVKAGGWTGWKLASDVEYLGHTYLDRANFRIAPSRTLVGASLGLSFHRLGLLVEGRNLGDELVEDVAGFPLPGRMIFVSLSLDLQRRTP